MYPRVAARCPKRVPGFDAHLGAIERASAVELGPAHAIFVIPVARDRPLAGESFRIEAGAALSAEERRWLDANLDAAWTSYWQVEDVAPGRSITLRDIFSEEVRTVIEASASRMAAPGDLLCARVVTVSGEGGESYMDIAHTRVLGARDGRHLREALAIELGLTKRKAVPVARLRDPRVASALLVRWVERSAITNGRPRT